MKIGGFQKCSLTHFPGKRAAVVFTQGCDWRCPYCYNRSLVLPSRFQPSMPEEDIFAHLQNRPDDVSALVVTGGEPTYQHDLPHFLRRCRSLGLFLSLETNGAHPDMLDEILEEHLLDFIAIDIKGPLQHYARFTGCKVDTGAIEVSLERVRTSGIAYELRTTLVKGLHTEADMHDLAPLVTDAARFAVQSYQVPPYAGASCKFAAPDPALIHCLGAQVREQVAEFIVR